MWLLVGDGGGWVGRGATAKARVSARSGSTDSTRETRAAASSRQIQARTCTAAQFLAALRASTRTSPARRSRSSSSATSRAARAASARSAGLGILLSGIFGVGFIVGRALGIDMTGDGRARRRRRRPPERAAVRRVTATQSPENVAVERAVDAEPAPPPTSRQRQRRASDDALRPADPRAALRAAHPGAPAAAARRGGQRRRRRRMGDEFDQFSYFQFVASGAATTAAEPMPRACAETDFLALPSVKSLRAARPWPAATASARASARR